MQTEKLSLADRAIAEHDLKSKDAIKLFEWQKYLNNANKPIRRHIAIRLLMWFCVFKCRWLVSLFGCYSKLCTFPVYWRVAKLDGISSASPGSIWIANLGLDWHFRLWNCSTGFVQDLDQRNSRQWSSVWAKARCLMKICDKSPHIWQVLCRFSLVFPPDKCVCNVNLTKLCCF